MIDVNAAGVKLFLNRFNSTARALEKHRFQFVFSVP
jgi:hypothetical protein